MIVYYSMSHYSISYYLRPISLLTLSLLTLLGSNFPGVPLWAWEFHPLELRSMLESNPPKSRMLVRRLAVTYDIICLYRTVRIVLHWYEY